LIMDQSKLSDRHQVLMLAVRHGERALPLAWRVEATEGAIGLSIYQFRHTAQSGGRGKPNRMSLMMRRSPRVNHEVLLRATFLG
jgi:hypothetical protein